MHRAKLLIAATLFVGVTLGGCATTPLPTYDDLLVGIDGGATPDPDALREAFVTLPDFAERVGELGRLEQQALDVLSDQPIRLGAVGEAILDTYYGSLTGHRALVKFYEHLGSDEDAHRHAAYAGTIADAIQATGTGLPDAPYTVITPTEARAFLIDHGQSPAGSLYQVSDQEHPFTLWIAAKPDRGRMETHFFDLGYALEAARLSLPDEISPDEFTPMDLIGALAPRGDPAAQTFIGYAFAHEERLPEAVLWLRQAAQSGNVLANLMLARVHWSRANTMETGPDRDEVLELVSGNYVQAVAAGSDDAMFRLGALYITGELGEGQTEAGIALVEQAVEVGNIDAMLFLARSHYQGLFLDRDIDLSDRYYQKAAGQNDADAKLEYARFLLDPGVERDFSALAYGWLEEVADADNAQAMLMLGNLSAKGVFVEQDFRRAQRWFRDAVGSAPKDPSIVNEVAWTLTVSNLDGLRKPRYALRIMNGVMEDNDIARRTPAYLDTWAAAHAANGDFDRAVALQEEAVEQALINNATDVLDILREHLEAFRAGETISDVVP